MIWARTSLLVCREGGVTISTRLDNYVAEDVLELSIKIRKGAPSEKISTFACRGGRTQTMGRPQQSMPKTLANGETAPKKKLVG